MERSTRSRDTRTFSISAGPQTKRLIAALLESKPPLDLEVRWNGERSARVTVAERDARRLAEVFASLSKALGIQATLTPWTSPSRTRGQTRDDDVPILSTTTVRDISVGDLSVDMGITLPGGEAPLPAADDAPAEASEDPPRRAYGLLQCPDSVVAEEEIELVVGLSGVAPPGVAGPPLERPEGSTGPYTMTIQVVADGFSLREGESFRQALPVTAAAPFPTCTLHLTPERQTAAKQKREIHASYTVDGQPLGFAVRYVTVVRKAPAAPAEPATAAGVNISVPTAGQAADLTAVIRRQPGSKSTLLWTFESRHPLDLPDTAIACEVGDSPEDFARRVMIEVNKSQGQDGTYQLLLGHGRKVQQCMPPEFWTLLRAAAAAAPGLPSVLFLSQDPFIPWELAAVEKPLLDPGAAPFLGAQAVVGRWVQPAERQTRPRLPPPAEVAVQRMVFVTGVYAGPTAPRRLKEAEAEVDQLAAEFQKDDPGRVERVEATLGKVLDSLSAAPGADLFHFSLHGRFDRSGMEDGLLLVDQRWLMPAQVEGSDFGRQPFVFLNACQVGQGDEALGMQSGMAAAFLFAGASAVVAPLWSVDDKVAHEIALDFYQETLRGDTPAAEVLRRARARFTRGETAATYLSYQFFGHPEMRLRLET